MLNDVAVVAGANALTIAAPGSATLGNTFARFRYSTTGGGATSPTGLVSNGEVEDYSVSIGVGLQ